MKLIPTVNHVWCLALLLGVWVVSFPSIQFADIGTFEPDQLKNTAGWSVEGETRNAQINLGRIEVTPAVPGRSLIKKQIDLPVLTKPQQFIMMQATIQTTQFSEHDLIEQNQPIRRSILYAWFENELKERESIEIITEGTKQHDTRSVSKTIAIPPSITNVNLGLLFRGKGPGMVISELSVWQLERRSFYWLSVACLAGLAACLCVFVVRWIVVRQLLKQAVLASAAVAVVFIGLLFPGNLIRLAYLKISGEVPINGVVSFDVYLSSVQDVGHILGFTFLSFVLLEFAKREKDSRHYIIFAIAYLSVLAEVLQAHSIQRSFTLQDIVWNLLGSGIGLVVWILWDRVRCKLR